MPNRGECGSKPASKLVQRIELTASAVQVQLRREHFSFLLRDSGEKSDGQLAKHIFNLVAIEGKGLLESREEIFGWMLESDELEFIKALIIDYGEPGVRDLAVGSGYGNFVITFLAEENDGFIAVIVECIAITTPDLSYRDRLTVHDGNHSEAGPAGDVTIRRS